MKMPNLASVNQAGVGLLSMESQVGWYCALAAIEAAMSNRPNGFIDEAVPLPIQFRIYGPDGPRAPTVLRLNSAKPSPVRAIRDAGGSHVCRDPRNFRANRDRVRRSITVFLGAPDAGSSQMVGHSESGVTAAINVPAIGLVDDVKRILSGVLTCECSRGAGSVGVSASDRMR